MSWPWARGVEPTSWLTHWLNANVIPPLQPLASFLLRTRPAPAVRSVLKLRFPCENMVNNIWIKCCLTCLESCRTWALVPQSLSACISFSWIEQGRNYGNAHYLLLWNGLCNLVAIGFRMVKDHVFSNCCKIIKTGRYQALYFQVLRIYIIFTNHISVLRLEVSIKQIRVLQWSWPSIKTSHIRTGS